MRRVKSMDCSDLSPNHPDLRDGFISYKKEQPLHEKISSVSDLCMLSCDI